MSSPTRDPDGCPPGITPDRYRSAAPAASPPAPEAVRSPPASSRSLPALSVLVVGAGTATLALEISASRLLAPYYGSSTVVWANLIGIVLVALSLGYWLGGELADRRPSLRLLGRLVVAAGGLVALLPFVTSPVLDRATALGGPATGTVFGPFLATLLLFAPPVLVLGLISPLAVRLAMDDVSSAGSVAGRLYALSTMGSLAGVFLPAFVLIPALGTRRTLLASAAVLALSGAAVLLPGRSIR